MRRDVDGKVVEVAEVAEAPAEGPNDPMRNNCFCGRAHDPFFPLSQQLLRTPHPASCDSDLRLAHLLRISVSWISRPAPPARTSMPPYQTSNSPEP